jgi:microcystin-dependent protein
VSNTSPASLFGGTWEQLKDRFLLGAGNSYAVNATGGEATHTLTVNEMPSHNHVYNGWAMSAGNVASAAFVLAKPYDGKNNFGDGVQNTGGSAPHNNMPPYLAVYMWKRIA